MTPEREALTYKNQPNNVVAWRLGEACRVAADERKCGDYIDRGLILLRELEARGYGVVALAQPPAPAVEPDPRITFFDKYALGPMRAPSCLVCGQLPIKVAITHGDLPGIVVCEKCVAATRAAPAVEPVLYEVRVAGPDDVHRHQDELSALRQANAINVTYLRDRLQHPDDEVLCVAAVYTHPAVEPSKEPDALDAARYQHLRKHEAASLLNLFTDGWDFFADKGAQLDAVIDAARLAAQGD